jgi:hypothetical protein
MNSPAGVLAVGAILLTIMGGIAGNIFTMAVHRFRKGDHEESRIIDWTLCILVLIFIFIVLAPFAGLIATTNFESNPTLYIYCLGILFGVVGSTLSDFFIAAYEGSDVRAMALIGGLLVVYIGYLCMIFLRFS